MLLSAACNNGWISRTNDDGQRTDDLEQADIVLLGVSRTSKTPTSLYLANRGFKTANVSIVPDIPVPSTLEHLTRPLVVGFVASPQRIAEIRRHRLLGMKDPATRTISTPRKSPRRSPSPAGSARDTSGRSSTSPAAR